MYYKYYKYTLNMGTIYSDLKNANAFNTIGLFIILKSLVYFIISNDNEERRDIIKNIILGAILIEVPNIIDKFITKFLNFDGTS